MIVSSARGHHGVHCTIRINAKWWVVHVVTMECTAQFTLTTYCMYKCQVVASGHVDFIVATIQLCGYLLILLAQDFEP